MASFISSTGVHEPEHSHQLIATHESLMSSNNQSLIKTKIEDSIMTDQSHSSETVESQIISNDEFIPTQKSFGDPSDQIVSETEAKDIVMTEEADAQERGHRRPSTGSKDVQSISKEEFIHSNQKLMSKPCKKNKQTSKRGKKQKSRIAEPTIQADLDGDSPIDARAESQVCRKALQDPKTKLQETTIQLRPSPRELRARKNQFSHAQDDFQKVRQVQQELPSVRRGSEAFQDDLRRTQNTCRELKKARKKLAASQDELTACKDELFRLQPIAQVPDSRVAKEFENLCQQIVNWIEAEVVIFEKAHPEKGPEYIFSTGEDKEAAQFMNQHPRSGEHLAAYLIHRWLQGHLFGQKLSCLGLPAEAVQLVERAEQSMARLDPPRDSKTIAAWRSETFKALASTEECEKTRIRETQDMNGRLFKDLSKTLPVLFTRRETHSSFYVQILRPAVDLARAIQESTTRYAWLLHKGILGEWTPFSKAALEKYKIVDIKTGKCLKPDSLVTAGQQEVVGNAVLMIEPALSRANGGRQWNTLKQGTFVANLKFPIEKRNRHFA